MDATIRPVVLAFAGVMETKLRENDHKGHWDYCALSYLRKRLQEEMAELFDLLSRSNADGVLVSASEACSIAREAADVANFAMMIADNCGGLGAASAGKDGK